MARLISGIATALCFVASVHADSLNLLRAGLAARIRGDLSAAIHYYTQAIDTGELAEPQLAIVLNSRGVAYDIQGHPDRAIADFDAAIRINPDYGEAHINRGLAWAKKREYSRAFEDFTTATRDDSSAFLAFNNRANIYGERGDYNHAIEDYSRAIRLKPDYAEAYYGRANVYVELGDPSKAIPDFDAAIRLKPNDAMAFNDRAYAYQIKREYDRAIPDLDEAIRLKPFSSKIYLNRGVARLYLGRTEAAIEDFATAVRLDPSDTYAVIWLHLARARAGQNDRSELARNSAGIDRSNWPGPLLDLHLGSVSREAISGAALSSGDVKARRNRACQIEFYLATWDLEQGARDQAQQHLRTAADVCPLGSVERLAAEAELGSN
jgi:tetratricopeptide (TPR) repeat protein